VSSSTEQRRSFILCVSLKAYSSGSVMDGKLFQLVSTGGSVRDIRTLIDDGARVDATDRAGWTPLHWACRGTYANSDYIAKGLLTEGAPVKCSHSPRRDSAAHCIRPWMYQNRLLATGSWCLDLCQRQQGQDSHRHCETSWSCLCFSGAQERNGESRERKFAADCSCGK
jgi:hypothetical protein